MKTLLVTGCNRGIGLGIVKQLIKQENPPEHIIATCRDISKATELKAIADENPNVKIIEIDLKNLDKYDDLVAEVQEVVKGKGLNVLINNAGISSKFTRVSLVKAEQMIDNFVINTVAPLMLSKACLPLLKKASENYKALPLGASRAAIINISSILGSIHQNVEGGFYPYRSSKAALNSITKSLSLDLKNEVLVTSIHPGWCKTDMGGKNAPLEVDVAVRSLLKTISQLGNDQNGSFIQYDGSPLKW